jgi:hypothetical protein
MDHAAAFPGIHLGVLPSRAAVFAAVKKDPGKPAQQFAVSYQLPAPSLRLICIDLAKG